MFDPSQPFEKVGGFDPSQPFEKVEEPTIPQALGHSFVNNLPLGGQMAAGAKTISNDKGYSENLADWNKQTDLDKAAHPLTYGVGSFAGAAAPLLIPGVGEALEAAPIAGNALYGAANAIGNTDLLKNPGQAAKEAVVGGGIGGTVGAVAKGLSSAVGGVGDALAPAARRIEANTTANALDINPRALFKMAQRENANPETIALNINKKMQEILPDTIGLNDTAASKYDKLLSAHDQASKTIGDVIEKTDKNLPSYNDFSYGKFKSLENPYLPEVVDASNKLKAASNQYAGMQFEDSVQSKAILDDTRKMLANLQQSGKLNFQNLSLLKQEVGQIYHNPNNVVRGVDQAYGILSDAMNNVLERTSVSNPELKPAYDKAKDIFKFTSDILPAMGRGVSREVAGKGGSLANTAIGAGAIFGHPLAAGAAYAGKTAAHLGFPELPANLAYKAVNALKNGSALPNMHLGQGVNQELIDLLESKYGNQ